jgi:hypothetical protein
LRLGIACCLVGVGSDTLIVFFVGVSMTLEEEAERATALLLGKVVKRIVRHRDREVLIQFADGDRLFVDGESSLELSIELH